jgi:hypothetical protein
MTHCALPDRVRSVELTTGQQIRELARFLLSQAVSLATAMGRVQKARGGAHPWSMGALK